MEEKDSSAYASTFKYYYSACAMAERSDSIKAHGGKKLRWVAEDYCDLLMDYCTPSRLSSCDARRHVDDLDRVKETHDLGQRVNEVSYTIDGKLLVKERRETERTGHRPSRMEAGKGEAGMRQ